MKTLDKIPLVLLPGLINDERLWQSQIESLADLAECSVGDVGLADSIPALAASVLSQAPAPRFALAGLSMGGYVALEIMRQAPERVVALALLDTSARADTAEGSAGRRKLIQQSASDFDSVIATLLPKMVHPDHLDKDDSGKFFTRMARAVGKDVFIRQQNAIMHRIDSRASLALIRCPTLVLCGREDALTPVAVHEEIADGIPNARLVIVERCGHLSPIDQPAAVAHAMRDWLMTESVARTSQLSSH